MKILMAHGTRNRKYISKYNIVLSCHFALYFHGSWCNQGCALSLFQTCSLYTGRHLFLYKNKYINVFHPLFSVVETAQKDFETVRRIRKEILFCSAFLNLRYFFGAVEVAGLLSVLCKSTLDGVFSTFEFCPRREPV